MEKFIKLPFLLFVALIGLATDSTADQSSIGTITAIEGHPVVVVQNSLNGKARECKTDDPIFEKDKIITRSAQVVKIELREKSELVIGPDSNLVIESYTSGRNQTTIMNLAYGMLRSLVRRVYRETDTFAVRTASATMGVRGTHFVVEVDRQSRQTALHTLHGTVAIANSLDALRNSTLTAIVPAGFTTNMRSGMKKADPPKQFDSSQYRQKLQTISPSFNKNVGRDDVSMKGTQRFGVSSEMIAKGGNSQVETKGQHNSVDMKSAETEIKRDQSTAAAKSFDHEARPNGTADAVKPTSFSAALHKSNGSDTAVRNRASTNGVQTSIGNAAGLGRGSNDRKGLGATAATGTVDTAIHNIRSTEAAKSGMGATSRFKAAPLGHGAATMATQSGISRVMTRQAVSVTKTVPNGTGFNTERLNTTTGVQQIKTVHPVQITAPATNILPVTRQ